MAANRREAPGEKPTTAGCQLSASVTIFNVLSWKNPDGSEVMQDSWDQSANLHQFPEKKPEVGFTFCNFFSWSPKVFLLSYIRKLSHKVLGNAGAADGPLNAPRTNLKLNETKENPDMRNTDETCAGWKRQSLRKKSISLHACRI